MLKFGLKVGLVAGTAYYLTEEGVWDNSIETEKLYNKISSACKPYKDQVKNKLPFEVPQLPEADKVSFAAKHYWNRGVQSTFGFVAELPANTCRWTRQGINAVKNNKEIQNMFAGAPPEVVPVPGPAKTP